ncbi:MFS transporter [Streptomyces cinnabarinus]|uniref:MFS transporter n=1 Tax=Streptomyces cinnabarinus TaxID=67287 RepID=A0ABY7KE35_9ACTN|nr:MFS transporter [Streptomyces cinnabarinus]WAZ21798.1 MFS transporter [Streptomyces cinnabarinus]
MTTATDDRPPVVSPLRVPAFRSLWAGDSVSQLAHQVTQFLLPLLAVTVVHTSGFGVGVVSASQFLPVIFLSLVAGSYANKVSTRALLVLCNVLRGVALGLMGVVCAFTGLSFWLLVAAAVVIGCVAVFHDVGFHAAFPRVLTTEQLTPGNGLYEASYSAAQMAGPALAGYAVHSLGLSTLMSVTAVLFLASALCFLPLRLPALADHPDTKDVSVRAGLAFIWRTRAIRDLCVQSALYNLHEQAFLTAFMIYGVRSLHLSGGALGLVMGLGSLGAVAGSLVIGRIGARLHVGAALSASLVLGGLSLFVGALVATPGSAAPVLAAAFVVNGAALASYNVFALSLRGALPPPEHLGIVTAGYRLVSRAPMPLGALLGGVLVETVGGATAVTVIALSLTLAATSLLRSPLRRVRRLGTATSAL